ncbi:hypothetical protein MMC12_003995 [Toensbergia leucococca]|nr:hypothetical protein [Toensbergia leucococca]
MFPKKHSFSYSYLLVGIPVGWKGSVGSFLSADLESLSHGFGREHRKFPKTWLAVDAADYLNRGDGAVGLQGKLEEYLKSQGEIPSDYAHAYLITAPRFLGYSFNPVSFWYLYNEERQLKAMILEVNNTFDERRLYFLKDTNSAVSDPEIDTLEDGDFLPNGSKELLLLEEDNPSNKSNARFTNTWGKDFHVSPFNSRKGSYALSANDPFFPYLSGNGQVNNTITLSSSKNHPKLVARVFSTQPTIDPSNLTFWTTLSFVTSWWWVGFVTFPRIVREAAKLFFRRRLHVWFRPEVLKDSIGRQGTKDERAIEKCFRGFLRSEIEQSNLDVPVRYTAAIFSNPNIEIFFPKALQPKASRSSSQPIEFKVLTPLFYDRIARHAHISQFLRSELLNPKNKGQGETCWVSHPNQFHLIFLESNPPSPIPILLSPLNRLDRVRWTLLLILRQFSSTPLQPDPSLQELSASPPQPYTRLAPLSSLDAFALSSPHTSETQNYRKAVFKLLASSYLTFGLPSLIDAISTAVSILLCYTTASATTAAFLGYAIPSSPRSGIWEAVQMAAYSNSLHIWRLFEKCC